MFDFKRVFMLIMSLVLIIVFSFGFAVNLVNAEERTIKIGFPAPLSGPSAGWGAEMEKGIMLAIEDLNEAGGILGHEVELVRGDVEGQESSTVISEVRRLITAENVDFMVTGAANPSLVEADMMEQYGIPYILYGYAMEQERLVKEEGRTFKYVHNAIPSYELYQTRPPELINQWAEDGEFNPNNKKVAVIKSQNAYSMYCGDGIIENFEELGWEVILDETIPYERFTEFGPFLSQIREEEPAVIAYTDHTASNAANFLSDFLSDPTDSIVYLQATPSYPEFKEIMDGDQEGVIWTYAASLLGEKAEEFEDKFRDRFDEGVDPYNVFVYDAMMMAADAMEKAGDPFDKEAVNNVLLDEDYEFEGYIGVYKFDPETRLTQHGIDAIPFVTYQEWGDPIESIVIDPSEVSTGSFQLPPWFE